MKILIIESCEKKINRNFSDTSIVHVRNSIIIQNILQCDLISHVSEIESIINNTYDVIICMYGSPYMKYNAYMKIMEKNNSAKMFWLVNDHDLEDNILLRKWLIKYNTAYNMICNNPREGYRHWILGKNMHGKKLNDWINEWHTTNLNCLIYNETNRKKYSDWFSFPDKNGCIYFGTFRKHRIKDMLEYNSANYVISTSKKNIQKYKEAGITTEFTNRLNWSIGDETLYNYKYSIYFEDIHTHTNYAFMANRYYESLMCDVLMFFDYRCNLVMDKSGYYIDEYLICKNGDELQGKIDELDCNPELYQKMLKSQQQNIEIIQSENKKVEMQIKNVFNV